MILIFGCSRRSATWQQYPMRPEDGGSVHKRRPF